MTLVVLAAGMGSRYKGLKQVDPISRAGEFIIDFSVYDAIRSGFSKVVFIIKRDLYDTFRQTIGKRLERFVEVRYVFQENQFLDGAPVPPDRVKPFGTAHALLACLGEVNEPFVVINADDFYGADAFRCVAEYLQNHPYDGKCHFCMAGYVLDNTLSKSGYVSRGECFVDASGYLTGITERTKICEDGDTVKYLDGDRLDEFLRLYARDSHLHTRRLLMFCARPGDRPCQGGILSAARCHADAARRSLRHPRAAHLGKVVRRDLSGG